MSGEEQNCPRVGIPWRTIEEGISQKLQFYLDSINRSSGEAVPISLRQDRENLQQQIQKLDAFVLPGSPRDVEPSRYGAARHPKSNDADRVREETDLAILDHAFARNKPVLAICYGVQLLNVALGGSLYQDIASELKSPLRHDKEGWPSADKDPEHPARIEPGGELGQLAAACGMEERGGSFHARVNTSHHQSIRDLGRGLRLAAMAPDGVVEAIEHEPHKHWVVGVQWHPERMPADPLAEALFRSLIEATRAAAARR